jgi:hypothetical protein
LKWSNERKIAAFRARWLASLAHRQFMLVTVVSEPIVTDENYQEYCENPSDRSVVVNKDVAALRSTSSNLAGSARSGLAKTSFFNFQLRGATDQRSRSAVAPLRRRLFSNEFKREAVKLVGPPSASKAATSRDVGIDAN